MPASHLSRESSSARAGLMRLNALTHIEGLAPFGAFPLGFFSLGSIL